MVKIEHTSEQYHTHTHTKQKKTNCLGFFLTVNN